MDYEVKMEFERGVLVSDGPESGVLPASAGFFREMENNGHSSNYFSMVSRLDSHLTHICRHALGQMASSLDVLGPPASEIATVTIAQAIETYAFGCRWNIIPENTHMYCRRSMLPRP